MLGGLFQGRPWATRPIPVSSRTLRPPHCKVRQTRHGLQCRFDDEGLFYLLHTSRLTPLGVYPGPYFRKSHLQNYQTTVYEVFCHLVKLMETL